jgi:hypothetical protein
MGNPMVPFKAAGTVLLVGLLLLSIKYAMDFLDKKRRR